MSESPERIQFSCGHAAINPKRNINLAGYAFRKSSYRSISDSLEANAVALRCSGNQAVIVSVDLLYVGDDLRSRVLERLAGTLRDDELFFAASHNHFAPAVERSKPLLGTFDEEYQDEVVIVVSRLLRSILDEKFQEGTILFKSIRGPDLNINRRRRGWSHSWPPRREMCGLPNPQGPRDQTIRVLQLCDTSSSTKAVIWGYCCHPVGFPYPDSVTAHYPGVVRDAIRESFGDHTPVVFLQGFTGNVDPRIMARLPSRLFSVEMLKFLVYRLLNGVEFGPFSESVWATWTGSLAESVIKIIRGESNGSDSVVNGQIRLRRVVLPVQSLGIQCPSNKLFFHLIELGKTRIVGISAEPVVEYVSIIEQMYPDSNVFPVGYIDDVVTYLPVENMLSEGGYEVDGFRRFFGVKGRFRVGFQASVEETLRRLV